MCCAFTGNAAPSTEPHTRSVKARLGTRTLKESVTAAAADKTTATNVKSRLMLSQRKTRLECELQLCSIRLRQSVFAPLGHDIYGFVLLADL